MNGGVVIGSGGFGCVFQPSLKCADSDSANNKSSKKYITKVMLKRHAEEEYNVMKEFRSILKKVKNYEKYFKHSNKYLDKWISYFKY